MPLPAVRARLPAVALDAYGVLRGRLESHHRDRPDQQGRWFHVNLVISAGGQRYRGAVDVDSKMSAVGVEWKTLAIDGTDLGPVLRLGEGYSDLAHTPLSGAVDCIRSPWLRTPLGRAAPPWTQGSNLEAATALEALLADSSSILVYGEPFTTGLGMHNIHQNQGDPLGSQWEDENGIWQDGATVVQRADGSFSAFVSKFTSQSYVTDDEGHPVEVPPGE